MAWWKDKSKFPNYKGYQYEVEEAGTVFDHLKDRPFTHYVVTPNGERYRIDHSPYTYVPPSKFRKFVRDLDKHKVKAMLTG